MSVQHANRGIVKKDLQLYYNREFVKSFRGEATINTCDLNTRVDYVWANAVATRDTTAPSTPPITGFEIAKLRSTDGQDAQTILYTAAVDQVNGGEYTHSAYIYLESGTWVSVGQHWNPWNYGVQTFIPKNTWTRVSFTVTNTPNNYGQVACSYNTNGVVYITATQYEKKSYSTPFVNGSRTANTIAGGGGLLDISGNNVNADLTNVSFNNTGYIFSGSQYITVPYSSNLDRNDFTIAGYFRTSTNDNSHDTIVSRNSDVYGATNGWNISRLRNGLSLANCFRFMIYGDSATATEPQGPAIADNVWRHFAVVVDKSGSNTVTIYINGVAYSIPAALPAGNHYPSSGSPPLYIGCNKTNADLWNGEIPQILYYQKALTAAEVSQNFNATRKTYGI
jgi:hypothetical protein